jgi:hypothetical protein
LIYFDNTYIKSVYIFMKREERKRESGKLSSTYNILKQYYGMWANSITHTIV